MPVETEEDRIKELMAMPKEKLVSIVCTSIDRVWELVEKFIHLSKMAEIPNNIIQEMLEMNDDMFGAAMESYDEAVAEYKKTEHPLSDRFEVLIVGMSHFSDKDKEDEHVDRDDSGSRSW